ncbi:diadenosine tetraphosphate hydrolase [Nocardia cyriacigeorgica]|uniref:diadenosine tetraphosphate hydrolase n=1 Tax=Nocardia cyriacigeorgica TaxID=135487 RepID=UPI001E4888FF|nr:diadenosine tetraphosphate hydrolase [Nocardia cyriacigeorgica]
MIDYLKDPIGAARQGTNPTVVGRMHSGWAVMGGTQHLPGYCVLMHDGNADQLTELPRADRVRFMHDMVLLGEAVERACRAADPEFLRINYEVLGNLWPHLHGHIHARYKWEPDHLRAGPVYLYGSDREAPEHRIGPRHDPIRGAISTALRKILAEA